MYTKLTVLFCLLFVHVSSYGVSCQSIFSGKTTKNKEFLSLPNLDSFPDNWSTNRNSDCGVCTIFNSLQIAGEPHLSLLKSKEESTPLSYEQFKSRYFLTKTSNIKINNQEIPRLTTRYGNFTEDIAAVFDEMKQDSGQTQTRLKVSDAVKTLRPNTLKPIDHLKQVHHKFAESIEKGFPILLDAGWIKNSLQSMGHSVLLVSVEKQPLFNSGEFSFKYIDPNQPTFSKPFVYESKISTTLDQTYFSEVASPYGHLTQSDGFKTAVHNLHWLKNSLYIKEPLVPSEFYDKSKYGFQGWIGGGQSSFFFLESFSGLFSE